MKRRATKFSKRSGTVLVLSLLCLLCWAGAARAVALKNNAIVDSAAITVGDLFTGLDGTLAGKAGKIIAAAPLPGQDMVLDARVLLRVALAADLPWRPSTGTERIVLTRAGSIVPSDMIEDALQTAITGKGIQGPLALTLAPQDPLVLPAGQPASVEIGNLSVDSAKGRFEAVLLAPSAAHPLQRLPVSGAFERLVEVPVLAESLSPGNIIGARDLQTVQIHARDVKNGTILSAQDLEGLSPRRTLAAGQPIKTSDVESPRLVSRGDMVTVLFSSGALSLTARGKALEHGIKGDRIRVLNTASNKMIEGIVTASREVSVQAF